MTTSHRRRFAFTGCVSENSVSATRAIAAWPSAFRFLKRAQVSPQPLSTATEIMIDAQAVCTAPGHPECTIACDGGCIAIYWEPDGPCQTLCTTVEVSAVSMPAFAKRDSIVSVQAKLFPGNIAARVFAALLTTGELSSLEQQPHLDINAIRVRFHDAFGRFV
jgi:hypothetical protein